VWSKNVLYGTWSVLCARGACGVARRVGSKNVWGARNVLVGGK
jgi:hypothetical protein